MPWPTPSDYLEAMQNPRTSLGDAELQTGRPEEDKLGLPRPRGGSFASVYKVICSSRLWAVRCFLKEFLDQQERYAAISAHLAKSNFPFATHFQFVKQGIRVKGIWYPVIKMEWVQGEEFIRYVESNIKSPQKLLALGRNVVEIARMLKLESVAHGDLQHGNILIANGKPKLIDYDGMYVPAFKRNWITHEAGHPNYQLPRDEKDFGPGLDNFSVWVIYLSLKALSIRPSLWTQFKGGDDCLLFRRKDFEAPAQSLLLKELKGIPELQALANNFQSLLSRSPLDIPLFDPDSQPEGPKLGSGWMASHHPPLDQIPRPKDKYIRPNVPPAHNPTPWPTTIAQTIPPKPAKPSILVSPPMWGGPTGLAPIPPQPGDPTPHQPWFYGSPTGLAPIPPQPPMPSILHSPPAWGGPTGLPHLPEKPILTLVLFSPPSAMSVPPNEKKILGFTALGAGVLFMLLLPIAPLLDAINSRLVNAANVLKFFPLLVFLVLGALWLLLEWISRLDEQQLEAQMQLRAEAIRHYDLEMNAWRAAVSAIEAECQKQDKQWQEALVAKQAEAQGRYDQEMRLWRNIGETILAESLRQKKEWETMLAERQRPAQREFDDMLQSWQAVVSAMQAEKARRERVVKDAQQKVKAAEQNWTAVATRFANEYNNKEADLFRLTGDRKDNEIRKETEYKQMLAKAREPLLAAHLSQQLIEVAAISDIGPARKKTLQAHGVRTAWDVVEDRIWRILGFSTTLTANLMEWRRNVEATFIFKTAGAISPQEKQAFESKYEQLRQRIQTQMLACETQLKKISQDAENQLSKLTQEIMACLTELYQAEADLTVIPEGL